MIAEGEKKEGKRAAGKGKKITIIRVLRFLLTLFINTRRWPSTSFQDGKREHLYKASKDFKINLLVLPPIGLSSHRDKRQKEK